MRRLPITTPSRRIHPAIKITIGLLLLAGVVVLFFRSANSARAEPYSVRGAQLTGWTIEANSAPDESGGLVSLRPPRELPMNLFRQLFSRHMESLTTPNAPGIVLVLRREVPGSLSAEAVIALARAAGLGQSAVAPKCVGSRRISETGITRQVYFVWFDVPGFDPFRQSLAAAAGQGFAANGLSPVLLLAAQPDFLGWMPIVVDEQRDCIAPVAVE
ncbi:MAG: hypothetical protein ABI665_22190 [Vicinamibacterales bacterium]